MKNNIIILDTETGGLKYKENPITEIGLVVVEPKNFSILEQYETFVKPYNNLEITKKALEVSRVSMEEINKGVDAKVVVAKLISIFRKYTPPNTKGSKPILVGHNITFDLDFLEYIFDFCSKNLYDFVDRISHDTMRLMEIYERKSKTNLSYKLESCCDRFGIKLKSAHGALNDSIATRELFKALMNNLTPDKSNNNSSNGKKEEIIKSRNFFELP